MKRSTIERCIALAGLLMVFTAGPALAQEEYGIGESKIVPVVPSGNITLDGTLGEAEYWSTGATFDLLAQSNFWDDAFPADVEEATAFVLYSEDTLWVAVSITETEIFTAPEESIWQSDQILIGIDPVHTPGETDALEATGEEGYHGWPENAPDKGPYAYKIYPDGAGGAITLNWGFNEIDPVANGWARGVVWTDEEANSWGIEAAFYVPTVEESAEIGFNIGGGQANEAACTESEFGECAYGYFSQWSTAEAGSDIASRTASYGTLQMAGGGEGYGSGVTVEVPRVEPDAIVIDGVADEAAWENAQTDIDIIANWSGEWSGNPNPDVEGDTKLLWSDDTLYVWVHLFDFELFWGPEGNFGQSDQILVGIDNSFAGDSIGGFDPDFGGGAEFAPEGTYTYSINPPAGFTYAFSPDITPADSGWVNGVAWVDEENSQWGIEAAFYVPNVELGANIGFDVGGVQATEAACEEVGECSYAFYAWQTGSGGSLDAGAINRNASDWAALLFVEELGTSIEENPIDEVPSGFQLSQNYPNPFNPSTNIDYSLERTAHVTLVAYNVLGQQVATLVDGMRAAGTYRVQWEAGDLPSGTYLYRLEVDGATVATRAMLLVK